MRTALITGATDGIGKATALILLKAGWEVIIGGRNSKKCESTKIELRLKSGSENVSTFVADLANLSEVSNAVSKFLESHTRLDLLLLNANFISNDRIITQQGNEQNFAVGYLSRVLMIKKLEQLLEATPNSQVLSVIGLDTQPLDFNDPTIEIKFTGRKGLGRWQWAMNLFVSEYNKTGKVPLNLYMPGLVKTKVLANEPQPMRIIVKLLNLIIGITPEKSAENIYKVLNEVITQNKRGTCFAWKKERALPKIEIRPDDTIKLLNFTENLLKGF